MEDSHDLCFDEGVGLFNLLFDTVEEDLVQFVDTCEELLLERVSPNKEEATVQLAFKEYLS